MLCCGTNEAGRRKPQDMPPRRVGVRQRKILVPTAAPYIFCKSLCLRNETLTINVITVINNQSSLSENYCNSPPYVPADMIYFPPFMSSQNPIDKPFEHKSGFVIQLCSRVCIWIDSSRPFRLITLPS